MEKEFTATVYIVENDKVLLVHHKKFGLWMPPGGHVEPNETPAEAAKREALEETGWEISFIQNENVWIEKNYVRSFERPYLCLLQDIPQQKERLPHQHMDFIYFANPVKSHEPKENLTMRWFSLKEIFEMEPGKDIFSDTLDVLKSFYN